MNFNFAKPNLPNFIRLEIDSETKFIAVPLGRLNKNDLEEYIDFWAKQLRQHHKKKRIYKFNSIKKEE
jgi:hypothetical protein